MLGKSLMCTVAVKVRIINGAFLEACNALDDHYLRLAHELAPSSGMPETTKIWGADWIVLTYPATERR
jgi:hypothetical protein